MDRPDEDPAGIDDLRTLVRQERYAAAIDLSRREFDAAHGTEVRYLCGISAFRLQDHAAAIPHLDHARERGYDPATCLHMMGVSLRELGRHGEAVDAFEGLVAISPDDRDRSIVLLQQVALCSGHEAALRRLDAMPGFENPGDLVDACIGAELQSIREMSAERSWNEAERACTDLLALCDSPRAHSLLGYVYFQIGRYALAARSCRKACDGGLEDFYTCHFGGIASLGTGEADQAVRFLLDACRLAPGRTDASGALVDATIRASGLEAGRETFARLTGEFAGTDAADEWAVIGFGLLGETAGLPGHLLVRRQVSARDWVEERGGRVLGFEGWCEIPARTPKVFGMPHTPREVLIRSEQPYVTELNDVTIFHNSSTVLTGDGRAINAAGTHPRFGRYVSHRSDPIVLEQNGGTLLLDTGGHATRSLDAGIMLSGTASEAFGHWGPEYLTRLQFLERWEGFDALPIIVDGHMPRSHFDYLSCVASNEIVRLQPGEALSCKRLVYAPPPTFYPVHLLDNDISGYEAGPIFPDSYRYLKRKVEATHGPPRPTGRRVYLTRRNMKWSRIVNDGAVTALLESLGFETVHPETLDFGEQVRLFQSAGTIVAAGGSALQNIVFSDPSVKLIVLWQEDLQNWGGFCGQTGALGYDCLFVCGTAPAHATDKHVDFEIPLADLEAAVRGSS